MGHKEVVVVWEAPVKMAAVLLETTQPFVIQHLITLYFLVNGVWNFTCFVMSEIFLKLWIIFSSGRSLPVGCTLIILYEVINIWFPFFLYYKFLGLSMYLTPVCGNFQHPSINQITLIKTNAGKYGAVSPYQRCALPPLLGPPGRPFYRLSEKVAVSLLQGSQLRCCLTMLFPLPFFCQ